MVVVLVGVRRIPRIFGVIHRRLPQRSRRPWRRRLGSFGWSSRALGKLCGKLVGASKDRRGVVVVRDETGKLGVWEICTVR
jgi:hypothetical protein